MKRPSTGIRKQLGRQMKKDYFCPVVFEDVVIALKNKPSLGLNYKSELFVQCNQPDCQYVDLNQPPCPLHIDLFAKEIETREKSAKIKEWVSSK